MYEDRTFFNEVRKLDAAHCYRYSDGRLQSQQRYWDVAKDVMPDSLGDARQRSQAKSPTIPCLTAIIA